VREFGQAAGQALDLLFEVGEGLDIQVELKAFGWGKALAPGEVIFLEALTFRVPEVVAVREAVKAIDQTGVHLDEAAALGNELTEFADVGGRHPDFGDHVGGQHLGEDEGVAFVSLDAGLGDLLDADGVGDLDLGDPRGKQVVDVPGVGGGLNDDLVGREEVLFGPGGEVLVGDAARAEEGLPLGVDGGDEGVVFVDVQGDKTRG